MRPGCGHACGFLLGGGGARQGCSPKNVRSVGNVRSCMSSACPPTPTPTQYQPSLAACRFRRDFVPAKE